MVPNLQLWIFSVSSIPVMAMYLLYRGWGSKQSARHVHASLREDWFEAVSALADSESLAVQTLRNSMMTATMIASTSALGLMGAISLASSSACP